MADLLLQHSEEEQWKAIYRDKQNQRPPKGPPNEGPSKGGLRVLIKNNHPRAQQGKYWEEKKTDSRRLSSHFD